MARLIFNFFLLYYKKLIILFINLIHLFFLNEDERSRSSLLTKKTLFTMTKIDDEASDTKNSKENNEKKITFIKIKKTIIFTKQK